MRHTRMAPYVVVLAAVGVVMVAAGLPLATLLPYGLLLLCPLMMLFMMKGMASEHHNGREQTVKTDTEPSDRYARQGRLPSPAPQGRSNTRAATESTGALRASSVQARSAFGLDAAQTLAPRVSRSGAKRAGTVRHRSRA